MTERTRRLWYLMWLLPFSACAGRIHPTPAPSAPPPATIATPTLRFTATAYCSGRVTASGASVSVGVAAADPKVLPIGTVIQVTGAAPYDGSYRILDTGARVRRQRVDLYVPDCAAARRFGRRPVHVTVVRRPHE